MTQAERYNLQLAERTVRAMGELLRQVNGLRALAETARFHRPAEPILPLPRREYRRPAGRERR